MGVPESTPQLFGNSWKTLSACSPLVPGSLLDPCDVHLQAGEKWGNREAWGGEQKRNGLREVRWQLDGPINRGGRGEPQEGTGGRGGQADGKLPALSPSPQY